MGIRYEAAKRLFHCCFIPNLRFQNTAARQVYFGLGDIYPVAANHRPDWMSIVCQR